MGCCYGTRLDDERCARAVFMGETEPGCGNQLSVSFQDTAEDHAALVSFLSILAELWSDGCTVLCPKLLCVGCQTVESVPARSKRCVKRAIDEFSEVEKLLATQYKSNSVRMIRSSGYRSQSAIRQRQWNQSLSHFPSKPARRLSKGATEAEFLQVSAVEGSCKLELLLRILKAGNVAQIFKPRASCDCRIFRDEFLL